MIAPILDPSLPFLVGFLSGVLSALGCVLLVAHCYSRLAGQKSPITYKYPTPQNMELPYVARSEEDERRLEVEALEKQNEVRDRVAGLGTFR